MTVYDKILGKTAVALGFFDGVHLGHMALINKTAELALDGIKSMVYTFDMHPKQLFGGEINLLTDLHQKCAILESTATDYVYIQKISREFLDISPAGFVKEILHETLNAEYVVVGKNYTFGKNKLGNSEFLLEECSKYGIKCIIMPYITHNGKIVSSSEIRNCILAGNIKEANAMLGRKYTLCGKCISGRHDGTKIGFPTVNMDTVPDTVVPKNGVYATSIYVDGNRYASITNIGFAPTFGNNPLLIETNILGFNGDLYDKELCLEFIDLIRNEKKFSSVDELKIQIQKDIEVRRKNYE